MAELSVQGSRRVGKGFMSWLVGERLEFSISALQSHMATVLESRHLSMVTYFAGIKALHL